MPLWGWLLVFFGTLILLGFISDRMSKRKRPTDTQQVEEHNVDEVRRNQTDYHHFY
ncbi:hypothetical protein ACLM5H_00895 [Fredinandcohnia humi]